MADHEHATIKHSDQLLLDQFLLRLPNELLRKNFRSAHFNIEKDTHVLKAHLKDAGSAAASGKAQPADVLRSLDTMLARTRGMKRKLEAYAAEERTLHEHAASRIRHLDELYGIRTVDDVQYDAWSRKRLDRLVGDYLLRNGYGDTANVLAGKDGMEPLMDVSTFTTMSRVARSILDGSVTEALAWCAENKKELRKNESPLEFKLRLQQYIELLRSNTPAKTEEAIVYAKKHIVPYRSQYPREVQQACGLLAIPPSLAGSGGCAYGSVYELRWAELATLFTETHNKLLSLPSVPLLHVALSSGLSALKTPACHAHDAAAGTQPAAQAKGVCPICSTELNDLAKAVPYAHHTKSYVEHDLVLLPSGRAVGRQRLLDEAAKAGLDEGFVKDQANGAVVPVGDCRRVYIT